MILRIVIAIVVEWLLLLQSFFITFMPELVKENQGINTVRMIIFIHKVRTQK